MFAFDKGVIIQNVDYTDYELDGQGKGMIKMKNLLKKNLALLLALILCLSLAACGGNAPETLENIVLDDSIDASLEDTYDEYLGYWYLEDNGYICVSENNGTYFYELYDAYNDMISNGQLQYVKEYRFFMSRSYSIHWSPR